MRTPRRITVSGAAATMLAVTRPLPTKADTGPPPVGADVVVGDPFDPGIVFALGILAVVVVLVAVVTIRRPGSRRPIAATLAVLVASVVALAFVFAALFSDWSGQHAIYPLPLVVGIVVLILGLYVAVRILRWPSEERGR